MWTAITILGSVLLLTSGFLVREFIESRHISAELEDRFKKISATDIQPQPDWPKWARDEYNYQYKDYRATFDWCADRVQSLIRSWYTISLLEGKFQFLLGEQEGMSYILKKIEKYAKVPEMKIETQKRFDALREKIGQLPETSSLHSRYGWIEIRLSEMKTDNCDEYPSIQDSLESLNWYIDHIEEELNREAGLKAA